MDSRTLKKIDLFLKQNRMVLLILIIALSVRLAFFFKFHEILWDSGVYIGMGKYLFSSASAGIWEHIRPVAWPAALGFLWSLKMSPVFFGRMIELLLSLGVIYLVYLITADYFGKKAAAIASIITAFSSIFFYLGFHLYSEIPAVFFALLGIYLFIKKRYYLAGLFVGLAFAAKFPAGMFIVCFAAALLFLKPNLKKYSLLAGGFATILVPYLIFNHLTAGAFIRPFIDAGSVIRAVLGCNVLRPKPVHYYIYLPLMENFLHIFSLAGFYFYFKKFDKKKILPFLCLLLPFIYFTQLHCRDSRYFMIFMPFLAMFTGYGIYSLFDRFCMKKIKKRFFVYMLVLILLISAALAVDSYRDTEKAQPIAAEENYFRFLQDIEVAGEIWSSNPLISVYTDLPINKIYYPVYGAEAASFFYDYLQEKEERISYVFLDNCGGGIICAEEDLVCNQKTEDIFSLLSISESAELVYDESYGRCYYQIYKLN